MAVQELTFSWVARREWIGKIPQSHCRRGATPRWMSAPRRPARQSRRALFYRRGEAEMRRRNEIKEARAKSGVEFEFLSLRCVCAGENGRLVPAACE